MPYDPHLNIYGLKVEKMRLYIKGKTFTEWQEDIKEDNINDILMIAKYYINQGYDVKIEKIKGITK